MLPPGKIGNLQSASCNLWLLWRVALLGRGPGGGTKRLPVCQPSDQFASGTLSKKTARTANAPSPNTGVTKRLICESAASSRTAGHTSKRLRTPYTFRLRRTSSPRGICPLLVEAHEYQFSMRDPSYSRYRCYYFWFFGYVAKLPYERELKSEELIFPLVE